MATKIEFLEIPRKLTVLQVLPALEGGGVERGTLEVGKYLVEHGHRSLVMSAGGRMVEQLEREGSEHVTWPIGKKSLWTLRLIWAMRRFLAEEKVDVLHVRSRMPAWVAYLAWKGMNPATRPKLVTTVHGLYSVGRYSEVMTRGERVIAVSETVQHYILKNYPSTPPENITVIPRGVDHQAFNADYWPPLPWLVDWRGEYPQLAGKKVLMLPGRLTRLKGHEAFIALIHRLKQQGLSVHGLIVGGEDPKRRAYAEEMRRKVIAMGLENEMTFTGHRTDLKNIMAVSTLVFSLSSQPESFGRTTLEALSLGVPVVGYDHGGVGELLGELFPKGRVPLNDEAALIAKVEQLLANSAVVPAVTDFRLDIMLQKTLRVYQELAT